MGDIDWRARARRAEAQLAALREAAVYACEALAEPEPHYGYPMADDPRAFTPDAESSTDEERAAHARAVQAWNAGVGEPLPSAWTLHKTRDAAEAHLHASGAGVGLVVARDDGRFVVHAHAEGWGLGTSLITNERGTEIAAPLLAGLADTAAAAEAYRARIVEETAAPLRAERDAWQRDCEAVADALGWQPGEWASTGLAPAVMAMQRQVEDARAGFSRAYAETMAKHAAMRAAEAERDMLAVALAEVLDTGCAVLEMFDADSDEDPTRADLDASLCALRGALAALPADLADERDRRVRAEALEAVVLGHSCARPSTTYHGDDQRPKHRTCGACLVCQIRARAADERGGR